MSTLQRSTVDLNKLQKVANLIRKAVIEMASVESTVHVGSSLSVADILAVLWFGVMRPRKCNEAPEDHDWLILSKGHAAPAFYGLLAAAGIIPWDMLRTIREFNSPLQGHPDFTLKCVDAPTGSLSQGFSFATGVAKGLKMKGSDARVYVILGDGELDEGEVWEAASTASALNLDNLIAIVDWNGFQLDGSTDEVKPKGDLVNKWKSFGWYTIVVEDGHNHKLLLDAFYEALEVDKPSVILAKTIRGKGLPEIEGTVKQRIPKSSAKIWLSRFEEGGDDEKVKGINNR